MSYLKKSFIPMCLFIFSTLLTALAVSFTKVTNKQNQFLLSSIFLCLSVVLIVIFGLISKGYRLLDFKQKISKGQWRLIFSSLGLILLSSILLNSLFPDTSSENQQQILSDLEKSLPIMSVVLLSAPFFEEIIFRGFIYQNIFNKSITGLVVNLLIFTSLHLTSVDDLTLKSVLSYLIPGLLFTFVYKKTERLECAIILHFLYNLIPLLLSYLILIVEGQIG